MQTIVMTRGLLLLVFVVAALQTFAQTTGRAKKYTTTVADAINLSLLDDPYIAEVSSLEAPNPDGNIDKRQLRAVKQEINKKYPHKTSARSGARKTTAAVPPTITIGFIPDSLTGIPPDNDLCVSRGDTALSVMNSNITIVDVKTGLIAKRYPLKNFSNSYGAGLNSPSDYRFDPKVIYDAEADRYICVMLNETNEANYIVIGFSKTNSATGRWTFYKFYGDYKGDTTWFDYPAIAITKDEFFLTGNKIKFNASWQAGFHETLIYQINKAEGYAGATTLNYQIWDSISYNGRNIRNLFPVKPGTWLKGPAGPEQYFLSNRNFDVQNDTIFLVKLPGTIASGNQTLDIKPLKAPISYGVPPNGRQPDTVVLSTNDGRILGAYEFENKIQFVSTSVDTSNGASGIFHGIISDYKTSPVITHAKIISVDTLDFGYPNISFAYNPWDKLHSIISFNYTGPKTFPGFAVMNYDGSDYSPLVNVKSGFNSIKVLGGKDQRWGDYSGSQIDYNSYGHVWVSGIYGRPDNGYGLWMARVGGSFVGVKDISAKGNDAIVYPNPAYQTIHLEFSNPEQQTLNFRIYDIQGKAVDQILTQVCKKGRNQIRFNIASLPAGTYYLKAASDNGVVVMTEKFVRN